MVVSTMLYGNAKSSEVADCCPPPAPACPPKPCCQPVPVKPMPPCNICKVQDPCCPPMSVYNRNVNPPAACMNPCVNDIFVTGAFLWWLTDENDFSLGFNQKTPYVTPTSTVIGLGANGNIINFDYQWDPGFRVGLGWQSHSAEGWDIVLDWTWYLNKTTQTESAVNTTPSSPSVNAGQGIVPFWGSSFLAANPFYGNMKADYRLHYNMIDLELGRDFFVSCALSLRPFLSVEGGWIHREWNVLYTDFLAPVSLGSFLASDSYSTKSNYWGVGPRAGLGGNWWLGAGFKLFGNLSGSLLSGRITKNTASLTDSSFTGGVTSTDIQTWTNDPLFRVVPHLQAAVGAAYDICFSCEQYRFSISAGWEVNEFWNVSKVIFTDTNTSANGSGVTTPFNRANRSNNIALSGLTAEARFDF